MSDLIPDELERLLCAELATGQPFRVQCEYRALPGGGNELQAVLVRGNAHCATCQCMRVDPSTLPLDAQGHPRRCHWHHD